MAISIEGWAPDPDRRQRTQPAGMHGGWLFELEQAMLSQAGKKPSAPARQTSSAADSAADVADLHAGRQLARGHVAADAEEEAAEVLVPGQAQVQAPVARAQPDTERDTVAPSQASAAYAQRDASPAQARQVFPEPAQVTAEATPTAMTRTAGAEEHLSASPSVKAVQIGAPAAPNGPEIPDAQAAGRNAAATPALPPGLQPLSQPGTGVALASAATVAIAALPGAARAAGGATAAGANPGAGAGALPPLAAKVAGAVAVSLAPHGDGADSSQEAAVDDEAGSPETTMQGTEREQYARRLLHIYRDAEGVQAWIRDADIGAAQAQLLAQAMASELAASGVPLSALMLNGRRLALPYAGAAPRGQALSDVADLTADQTAAPPSYINATGAA